MSEKTRRDKTLKLIEDGDDDDWKAAVFILPSTRLISGSGFYFSHPDVIVELFTKNG